MGVRKTVLLFFIILINSNGCVAPLKVTSDPHKKINFLEIWGYAQRAAATYQSDQTIRTQFGQDVFIKTMPELEVKVFVETHAEEKIQWIAVRGTDNLENVKEDVAYAKIKDPILGIFLHRGFEKAASQIYEIIKPHARKDYIIRLTGHSLGGAIAVILEAYFNHEGYQVGQAITFGQPKVTNKEGMEALGNLPLLRVINNEDPVPLVPPLTLLSDIHGGYRHFGPELVLLPAPKSFLFLQQHDAERIDISSFWEHLGHEKPQDHHIENYLASIQRLVDLQKEKA